MSTTRLSILFIVVAAGVIATTTKSAEALDDKGLVSLQAAVREMCVQPDRKGEYLKIEGDLNAGAILKVIGVNGEGKITKEAWDGISQRLDKYKTDPRESSLSANARKG